MTDYRKLQTLRNWKKSMTQDEHGGNGGSDPLLTFTVKMRRYCSVPEEGGGPIMNPHLEGISQMTWSR